MRVVLLINATFENYYERELGLSKSAYLDRYCSEWSIEHARALGQRGLEVVIYIPSSTGDGRWTAAGGWDVRFLRLGRPARFVEWLPILRHTAPARYVGELLGIRCLWATLRAALEEDDVNVLYVQEYWPVRFDFLVRRVALPVIGVDQGSSMGRHLTIGKRKTFRRAAGLIAQTSAEQTRLRALGVESVLAPNFVDVEFFKPLTRDRQPEGGRLLLTVGGLNDWKKRISDLIRALSSLPSWWRLDVVGTGPDEDRLRALCRELGLADRVSFSGFVVDREILREKYWSCDVFSLPSSSEGLPLAALEAMACARPVVVSKIVAFDDLIEHGVNGMQAPLGRPDLLAEAIRHADGNSAMGQRARATVEQRHGVEAAVRLAEVVAAAGNSARR